MPNIIEHLPNVTDPAKPNFQPKRDWNSRMVVNELKKYTGTNSLNTPKVIVNVAKINTLLTSPNIGVMITFDTGTSTFTLSSYDATSPTPVANQFVFLTSVWTELQAISRDSYGNPIDRFYCRIGKNTTNDLVVWIDGVYPSGLRTGGGAGGGSGTPIRIPAP